MLMFNLCLSCSCLEFVCLNFCSALSELFLPGICLLALLFRLCLGCSCFIFVCLPCCSGLFLAWPLTACTTVQPLSLFPLQPPSGLFLPGIRLLVLLFNFYLGCSCLECVCLYSCLASFGTDRQDREDGRRPRRLRVWGHHRGRHACWAVANSGHCSVCKVNSSTFQLRIAGTVPSLLPI